MNYIPNAAACLEILRSIDANAQLSALPAPCDDDVFNAVLEGAAAFVVDVIAPLNRSGDETGAAFADGNVTMPPGFVAAYRAFVAGGWPSLSADEADGGQGLPFVLETILYEWLNAANHGFTMQPGLLHGAYHCVKQFAPEHIKSIYAPKLATGEWLGTMCLTEPHAGSDLGQVRTKATPQSDGTFALDGAKIFISGGEHDLTDNIVHLVLARLPDAPPGPKGLSLFLAPKVLQDGKRNGVHCDRIEEKMGIHASPTCAMRFEAAQSWMIGAPGRGLAAMFVMMNAARLHVAMQGIGTLDAAWQKAHAYAHERTQMRAPGSTNLQDTIVSHPAIARVLDTQRAWIDGGRVLAYQTAIEIDVATAHPDPARRAQAERWCALLTPILKSAWTEQGFHGASALLQVFGGHGFVREWGIEQHVRDIRVAMIYEGTNEIQANDLLIRKVLGDRGAAMFTLLDQLQSSTDTDCALLGQFRGLTQSLVDHCSATDTRAFAVAGDYLRAAALALLELALQKCPQHRTSFEHWIGPEFAARAQTIQLVLKKS